ncbi:hypothetical protein Nans01_30630 [Nocardiopsis ansamitocini]|uniref:Uncharacterized protein n=1 Tax=Nocardiopsis ansamitocini TaxID=1670832 RepID=A0A9W6P814_9ACTN|nr:hypothetical protein Nans01_30630 [Nocardiopsis ansamitocini]
MNGAGVNRIRIGVLTVEGHLRWCVLRAASRVSWIVLLIAQSRRRATPEGTVTLMAPDSGRSNATRGAAAAAARPPLVEDGREP